MTILLRRRSTAQHDGVMGPMSPACPDFATLQPPAPLHAPGTRTNRGQVRACVGLAHTNRKIAFTACNSREKTLTLLLATIAQQKGTRLSVGNPVCGHRRSGSQQFLGNSKTFERRPLMATVLSRPG